jgi:oligopeptide/dipeptide ABC transporter ATP-binding protein
MTAPRLLEVENLKTYLHLRRGVVRAVDGVSLHVSAGETLGLVGESGSGKTMTSLSILRLLPKESGGVITGAIRLDGRDLATLTEAEMAREIRGRGIAMVSQDPMTSLNPVFTIGDQVTAPLRYHHITHGRQATRQAAIEALRRVRIPAPERRLGSYPHQFSGGMRQRVVTAMALACAPKLLIADEPTTALDVTIQAQMIALLKSIQDETGIGIILITHDLSIVARLCSRIAVMYAGRIVETGPVRAIYRNPQHPYTRALLEAIPHLGQKRRRLAAIPGQPPSLIDPPDGCRFAPRCAHRMPVCEQSYPPVSRVAPDHEAACWLVAEQAP